MPDLTAPTITDEQREAALEQCARLVAHIQEITKAAMPALLAATEQLGTALGQVVRQLQDAGLLDANGKPTRPADRPAWQTPYGPPGRRH
ncbi:hypothetical protein ABT093_09820 [Kitasatospora sp. NPDC002551]|uniref:hypothetical protein n=1 Tax=Kitasatospora sp. NPDC002551 TaxID=3154539 RepID=UPI00331F5E98